VLLADQGRENPPAAALNAHDASKNAAPFEQ